jgi:hypothetical protein
MTDKALPVKGLREHYGMASADVIPHVRILTPGAVNLA